MHSRDHREAMVLALDQKRISMSCTPEHMVGALTKTPLGTIIFSDDDLPLEGRDHQNGVPNFQASLVLSDLGIQTREAKF